MKISYALWNFAPLTATGTGTGTVQDIAAITRDHRGKRDAAYGAGHIGLYSSFTRRSRRPERSDKHPL